MARFGQAPITTTETGGLSTESARRRDERAGGAAQVWRGPCTATVMIRRDIALEVRRDAYHKPLMRALGAAGLGEVGAAGQMFDEATDGEGRCAGFEHSFHCLDLELFDAVRAVPLVLATLRAIRAARGVDDLVSLEIAASDGTVERFPALAAQ